MTLPSGRPFTNPDIFSGSFGEISVSGQKGKQEAKQNMKKRIYRISHDLMFATVLAANPDLTKQVLEVILDVKIEELEIVNAQQILNFNQDAKYVRLDVFVRDSSGITYDIEMQVGDTDREFLPRRARYSASAADTEIYTLGMDTSDMKDFVSIFICMFDPFGKGLVKYTGRTMCAEDPEVIIRDGMTQIYLDAKTIIDSSRQISPELKSLLDFIGGKEDLKPTPLTEALQEQVDRYNEDRSWRSHAMRVEAEMRRMERQGFNKGLEKGLERGLEQGRKEALQEQIRRSILQMLRKGKSEEDILDCIPGSTPEEIAACRKELEQSETV